MCKKYRWLIAASLTALALSGCGSGDDQTTVATGTVGTGSSVVFTTNSEDVTIGADGNAIAGADQKIDIAGANTCVACHSDPQLSQGKDVANAYLAGKHVIHSTQIDEKTAKAEGCSVCHDPIGDGPTLEPFIDQANVPAGGLAAVTCEVCHGAGGDHGGIGPLPTPTPDFELCGECHGDLPAIQHPSSNNIIDNYEASGHHNGKVRNSGVCMRCHSDEGYRTYIGETIGLDGTELVAAMADKPAVGTDVVQCRTCHDPHATDFRVGPTLTHTDENGIIEDANGNTITVVQVFSSQFNLCTSCHQVFLKYTYDINTDRFAYELDGSRPPYIHPTLNPSTDPRESGSRTIWDTHFKYLDPADGTTVLIPGYNINAAAENACTTCHDPHLGSKP